MSERTNFIRVATILVVLFPFAIAGYKFLYPPKAPGCKGEQCATLPGVGMLANTAKYGVSEPHLNIKIGKEWTPLYPPPNPYGFRDGMNMYIPGGRGFSVLSRVDVSDVRVQLKMEMDGVELPLQTTQREDLADIKTVSSLGLQCQKPPMQACEVLLYARSDASDAWVIARNSVMWAITADQPTNRDGVECNSPGEVTRIDGKLACAYWEKRGGQ